MVGTLNQVQKGQMHAQGLRVQGGWDSEPSAKRSNACAGFCAQGCACRVVGTLNQVQKGQMRAGLRAQGGWDSEPSAKGQMHAQGCACRVVGTLNQVQKGQMRAGWLGL